MNPSDTPLLLIAWRRPHTLRQVIDAIRPVAPTRLFVACDGPNPERPGEAEKVAATRAVIEHEIDWPCQIERLYSDGNRGCRLGVSRAITWFFEQVEEGIILEDDCVPHPDFFPYCSTLLDRYRDDKRISIICGSNNQGSTEVGHSYFFSRLGGIWGWATWRRAWLTNDIELESLSDAIREKVLESVVDQPIAELRYRMCNEVLEGRLDSWDYGWGYSRLINNSLACVPRINLISNEGFGSDATHTHEGCSVQVSSCSLQFPLSHPKFFVPHASYDAMYAPSVTPSLAIRALRKVYGLFRAN